MSIRIKLSYETDGELAFVRQKLAQCTHRMELEPAKGRYKRAYFTLKPIGKKDDRNTK